MCETHQGGRTQKAARFAEVEEEQNLENLPLPSFTPISTHPSTVSAPPKSSQSPKDTRKKMGYETPVVSPKTLIPPAPTSTLGSLGPLSPTPFDLTPAPLHPIPPMKSYYPLRSLSHAKATHLAQLVVTARCMCEIAGWSYPHLVAQKYRDRLTLFDLALFREHDTRFIITAALDPFNRKDPELKGMIRVFRTTLKSGGDWRPPVARVLRMAAEVLDQIEGGEGEEAAKWVRGLVAAVEAEVVREVPMMGWI
jgi:hypothetical protein